MARAQKQPLLPAPAKLGRRTITRLDITDTEYFSDSDGDTWECRNIAIWWEDETHPGFKYDFEFEVLFHDGVCGFCFERVLRGDETDDESCEFSVTVILLYCLCDLLSGQEHPCPKSICSLYHPLDASPPNYASQLTRQELSDLAPLLGVKLPEGEDLESIYAMLCAPDLLTKASR
jgi:hypothetical protein